MELISQRLTSTRIVEGRDYSNLTKNLDFKIYNQDNYELEKNDINVFIAKDLYESIRSATDTNDNDKILKLFNFQENKSSSKLDEYEKKFDILYENQKEQFETDIEMMEIFKEIKERGDILNLNLRKEDSKFLMKISPFSEEKRLGHLKKLIEDLNEYKENHIQLVEKFNSSVKFPLSAYGYVNTLESSHQLLMTEIDRLIL